ncbi:MAG: TolC family protein, partial [Akkermansiaceae bacterium]
AESKLAAAQYQSTVLKVLGEIESSQINFLSRKRQLASAQRELSALKLAHSHAQSRFTAGTVSEAEPLSAKQNWLAGNLRERTIRRAALRDHITMTKALGGGM